MPSQNGGGFLFGGKVGNNSGGLALIIEELLMRDDSI